MSAQVYPNATSDEESRCKGSSGQGMEKAWDNSVSSTWEKSRAKVKLFWKHNDTKRKSEPKLQKYKGKVVLRRDIAKDDSGAYAVFTEQGSSAS